MINEIKIEGQIYGKERPELKTFQNGTIYFRFSIQHEGMVGQWKKKFFLNVNLFGQLAERFNQEDAWVKGRTVVVKGALSIDSKKDQSGAWKSYTSVACTELSFKGDGQVKPPESTQKPPAQSLPKPLPKKETVDDSALVSGEGDYYPQ